MFTFATLALLMPLLATAAPVANPRDTACSPGDSAQIQVIVSDHTRVINRDANQAWRGPMPFGLVRTCGGPEFKFSVESYQPGEQWYMGVPSAVTDCTVQGFPTVPDLTITTRPNGEVPVLSNDNAGVKIVCQTPK